MVKKRVKNIKNISEYIFMPLLIFLSVYGTLTQRDVWCDIASYSIILSTVASLLLFVASVVKFLM